MSTMCASKHGGQAFSGMGLQVDPAYNEYQEILLEVKAASVILTT